MIELKGNQRAIADMFRVGRVGAVALSDGTSIHRVPHRKTLWMHLGAEPERAMIDHCVTAEHVAELLLTVGGTIEVK